MILMKRAAAASAALVLMLLAVLTIPVSAASPAQVTIPITTVWAENSDRPEDGQKAISTFTLTALDGAPAPETASVSVDGEGKVGIGPIFFELPGDYYYSLTGNQYSNDNPVNMTVRITVINEDDGLAGYVSAYDTTGQAQDGAPKKDTVFEVTFKTDTVDTGYDSGTSSDTNPGTSSDTKNPPSNTSNNGNKPSGTGGNSSTQKPSGTSGSSPVKKDSAHTAVMSNLIFWLLLAIAALILAGGLHRLSAEE